MKSLKKLLQILLIMVCFVPASAQEKPVTVTYNGEKIIFDQPPVIENGRTLVPLRAIFEKLGAEVSWNPDTKTVSARKGDDTVTLVIDETTANCSGRAVTLDVPARIINSRTLVPVRFIADSFGVSVVWDEEDRCVRLTLGGLSDGGSADWSDLTASGNVFVPFE